VVDSIAKTKTGDIPESIKKIIGNKEKESKIEKERKEKIKRLNERIRHDTGKINEYNDSSTNNTTYYDISKEELKTRRQINEMKENEMKEKEMNNIRRRLTQDQEELQKLTAEQQALENAKILLTVRDHEIGSIITTINQFDLDTDALPERKISAEKKKKEKKKEG
jgi:hypothetical protein